jgi:hypothetical protein
MLARARRNDPVDRLAGRLFRSQSGHGAEREVARAPVDAEGVGRAGRGHRLRVMRAAEQAARAALGDSAIEDPDSGAVSGQFYEPIDDIARAALDKQDLGHGISGRTFRY